MFSVIADGDGRTYLALSAQDWHEYAAGMTATDVVIGYQASSVQYDRSSYGWIGQTAYTSSAGASDLTNMPMFGTNVPNPTTSHAANGYPMTRVDHSGHRDGTTAGTPPDAAATGRTDGTPGSIVAVTGFTVFALLPFGARLSNDRLLPEGLRVNATPDTVGGMTVVTAQTSDLTAQATESSGLLESDTSPGTPIPGH